MILGISQFVSNFVWGGLGEYFSTTSTIGGKAVAVVDFHRLFLVPFGLSLLAAVILALFFRPGDVKGRGPAVEESAVVVS